MGRAGLVCDSPVRFDSTQIDEVTYETYYHFPPAVAFGVLTLFTLLWIASIQTAAGENTAFAYQGRRGAADALINTWTGKLEYPNGGPSPRSIKVTSTAIQQPSAMSTGWRWPRLIKTSPLFIKVGHHSSFRSDPLARAANWVTR